MEQSDQILIGESKDKLFFSVNGRGNFQNSQPMKEIALTMMDQGKESFIFDLKNCIGMDSTFMGVLAGLAVKLKKRDGSRLQIINISAHNQDLLETLGLSQLVDIVDSSQESIPESKAVEGTSSDKAQVAEHMLEAHETLSGISEENQVKFKNVIDYIKDDLGKNKG